MKFISQVGLAMVAVVALVAGVTLLREYQAGEHPAPVAQPAAGDEVSLAFAEPIVDWSPPSSGWVERYQPGSHDFWFQNPNSVPVAVGLMSKSCKCAEVSICSFTAEQLERYRKGLFTLAAQHVAAIPQAPFAFLIPVLPGPGLSPFLSQVHVEWKVLEAPRNPIQEVNWSSVPIEARASGIVRVTWTGGEDKRGPLRLAMMLWAQAKVNGPSPRTPIRLELPLNFVPPLLTLGKSIDIGDLGLREERKINFACWSATRGSFSLQAHEQSNDPCITCTCTPLTADERQALASVSKGRVLAGYYVRVIVRERISESKQMELGSFSRRIVLTSDADVGDEAVELKGVIRGEIAVGAEEDKGQIHLGSFRARNGISKTVSVRTERADLTLRQEEIRVVPESLDYIKVRLEKEPVASAGSRPGWMLHVRIPPGSPSGKLPEHSAILLKIPGDPPRTVRIPITGTAFQ